MVVITYNTMRRILQEQLAWDKVDKLDLAPSLRTDFLCFPEVVECLP